jgi:hypothetical protein
MTRLLLLCGLGIALVFPIVSAQTETPNEAVLQFETIKNGTLIGKSILRMKLGDKVPLLVNNAPRMMVEVARHDGITEAVCEFDAADDKNPTMRMKLSQEPRSATVVIGKDIYEVKIALTPPR